MTTPEQRPSELSVRRAIDVFFPMDYYDDDAHGEKSRAIILEVVLSGDKHYWDVVQTALAFDAQDQLWQAKVEAARVEAVRACAKVCNDVGEMLLAKDSTEGVIACDECEHRIRSLLTSPQTQKVTTSEAVE